MKKYIILFLIVLLCFSGCRAEYIPSIKQSDFTPEPTPEIYDPSEYTLGIYGAPDEVVLGFIKKSDSLNYKVTVFNNNIEEALDWAKENSVLLIYGANEEDRLKINETAAYGCAIFTSFFNGPHPPVCSQGDFSYNKESSVKACSVELAKLLNKTNGKLLVCSTEKNNNNDYAFRNAWSAMKNMFELSEVELLNTEYFSSIDQVSNFLARESDITAIYAFSAECANLWAEATKEIDIKPIIICSETSKECLEHVSAGNIYAAYYNPLFELGETAADVIDKYLRTGEVKQPNIILEGSIITSLESIDHYININNQN